MPFRTDGSIPRLETGYIGKEAVCSHGRLGYIWSKEGSTGGVCNNKGYAIYKNLLHTYYIVSAVTQHNGHYI